MSIWMRLLIAVIIGGVVGVGAALLGRALGIEGSVLGGVAGALSAGVVVAMLRGGKKN